MEKPILAYVTAANILIQNAKRKYAAQLLACA